jgi:hypothetical protein
MGQNDAVWVLNERCSSCTRKLSCEFSQVMGPQIRTGLYSLARWDPMATQLRSFEGSYLPPDSTYHLSAVYYDRAALFGAIKNEDRRCNRNCALDRKHNQPGIAFFCSDESCLARICVTQFLGSGMYHISVSEHSDCAYVAPELVDQVERCLYLPVYV